MNNNSFLSRFNIKQKIIMLTVLIAVLISGVSLVVSLNNINQNLIDANKKKITNIVEITYNILETYQNEVQNRKLTLAEAQKEAVSQVDKMNYQGKNYIWLTDYNDNMLAHPTLQGKNIANVADINGIRFFHEGVALAKEKGEGFISYHWKKPGADPKKVFPKISYFKNFPDWKIVIATGVYVDEIQTTVAKTFFEILVFNIVALLIIIFISIFTIIKDIVKSMNEITKDLDENSQEVANAASELQAASEKLAEGSTEQASSIQETSSTLEETSSMVQNNQENTQQAAVLANQSKDYASKSYQEMLKMISAMDDLQKSSNEISKIIKVIDEIAFQTNILSLNAAVEAARAGDAGKGFAVVAQEVRSLAQRSANAAKETEIIIEHNIKIANEGSGITKVVQETIEEIDSQSKKVSDLLDEISIATKEQAQGIGQINKAVSQIETVISSNAQTAEESSSAAKSLFEQTLTLNDIIEQLKTIVDKKKENPTQAVLSKVKLEHRPKAKPHFEKVVKQQTNAPKKAPVKKEVIKEQEPAKPISKVKDSKKINPDDIIPLGDDF